MSVANAGPAAGAQYIEAEDPKDANRELEQDVILDDEEDRPVAPDQFDPKYEATKWEIWAYYGYYIGNNGLSMFNFGPTAAQNYIYEAAGDAGVLPFLGRERNTSSIILLSNGISFAVQIVLFLLLGSLADYGRWRPYILIFWSIVAFAIGFAWVGVHTAEKWHIGVIFYCIGLIAYQMCLTFWTAAFPRLARNTPEMRRSAEQFESGEITREAYDFNDMMARNRISNNAFIAQSAAEIIILAILVGILFAVRVQDSTENNDWGLSVVIAYSTAVWLVFSIPWFILEKKRPGNKIPAGLNIITVLPWTLWRALIQIWELKQTLLYLIGYFLLGDSLNTSVTVIATLQNSVIEYQTLYITYLFIVGIFAQLVGIFGFWHIQKRFGLSTKVMFDAVMIGIVLLDAWGMIGIWTNKFGFHNKWEFWLYQIYYGLFVCPWYSYSQIMISEVTPRGKEFLFFSLFSIMGKTSAFIGPIVSGAIIDASPSGNVSLPFYFLFGLSLLSFCVLAFFVDLKKSRIEQQAFLDRENAVKARRASVIYGEGVTDEHTGAAQDHDKKS